jgi:hypothetical protein
MPLFGLRAGQLSTLSRKPISRRGKAFLILALCVPVRIVTLFVTRCLPLQVLDTAEIAGYAERHISPSSILPHAGKAYTSYMCNLYAILAIHCIGFF